MLAALEIHNIALIDSLQLQFEKGLNVLSGETGAGKTIIIDSLNLALGGRADRELVRTGETEAEVRALFEVDDLTRVKPLLDELGCDCADGQILIERRISLSGHNVCRVCDRLVTVAQLKQVADALVEMHGQHEHQTLADTRQQLSYLDAYARSELTDIKQRVAAQYAVWHELRRQIKQLSDMAGDAQQRTELLKFQLSEIDELRVKPGEDTRLQTRVDEMKAFEKTGDALETADAALGSERGSALDQLRRAAKALERVADMGPAYESLSNRLNEQLYLIEDIAYEVNNMFKAQDFDPQLLERMEQRLSALNTAKLRYGPTLDDVLAHRQSLADQIEEIADADKRRHTLHESLRQEQAHLAELCNQLTELRREAAQRFAGELKGHLADLGMAKVEFIADVQQHKQASAISANGWDTVEFLLSANAGEQPRPLGKIASGGELSRTMLALKAVAAGTDGTETMIFDEIDTGISGRIIQAVGEKMAALASARQVIVITHHAPIAALADAQYLVEKQERGGRAYTSVRQLKHQERVSEIARIMGSVDEVSLNHAQHMLTEAAARRSQLALK